MRPASEIFRERIAFLLESKDRDLIIAFGENWSQKDCIANKDALMQIFKTREDFEGLNDKSAWIESLKKADRQHKGKLSKCGSESTRDKWARAEQANLKGIVGYFCDKLCAAKGSHNGDMRDLKAAYFSIGGALNYSLQKTRIY